MRYHSIVISMIPSSSPSRTAITTNKMTARMDMAKAFCQLQSKKYFTSVNQTTSLMRMDRS